MKYVRRRKLSGQLVKRVTIVLQEKAHRDLLEMKGTLGNSEAIEKLIEEKKNRLRRRPKLLQAHQ